MSIFWRFFLSLGLSVPLCVLSLPGGYAHATSFSVTSNADDGAGTLRAAIALANADGERSTITFNLTPAAVISPLTPLPPLSNPQGIEIRAHLDVTLSGALLALMGNGLVLESSGHLVEGLIIVSFPENGILVIGDGGHHISGCYIGNDGTVPLGNGVYGILVRSSNNVIGYEPGTGTGAGNVISGNTVAGIEVNATPGGLATLGNNIHGNYLGLNAEGTAAIPNNIGLFMYYDGLVGGTTPEMRNVISGNNLSGLVLGGSMDRDIQTHGNYIGLNAAGTGAVPNQLNGVVLANGGLLGGDGPGEGNVISGNLVHGVLLNDSGGMVKGNWIGVAADGVTPLGNQNGVSTIGFTGNYRIGGATPAEGNIIAHNQHYGVDLDNNVTATVIRHNSIYANGDEGIRNAFNTNANIEAPTITSVSPVTGTTVPDGIVDLYADSGEQGQYFVATIIASETGDFSEVVDLAPYAGLNLTAIVTGVLNNSSPFSDSIAIPEGEPVAPATPGQPSIVSRTETSMTWTWADNSANESGFRVYGDPFPTVPATLRATLGANENTWTHEGLTPNVRYAIRVEAFNLAGPSSLSPTTSSFTLAGPPSPGNNVAADPGPNTAQPAGTTFVFTNPAGFGTSTDGGSIHIVTDYFYLWNENPAHTFNKTEEVWSSGSLEFSAATEGLYYLHLLSRNGNAALGGTLAYGPFIVGDVPVCIVGPFHTADQDKSNTIALNELLRVIQFFNSPRFGCQEGTEDGFAPNVTAEECCPHDSDYDGGPSWTITLSELLRLIQFFNSGGYNHCPANSTEDGYCPGL